jgi:hypothetical protein
MNPKDNILYSDICKLIKNKIEYKKRNKEKIPDITQNNIKFVLDYFDLSENLIEKYEHLYNDDCWRIISIKQILSEQFIEKYANKLNLFYILVNQKLSEDFLSKHIHKFNWKFMFTFKNFSEKFIIKNIDIIDLEWVSLCQKLSEDFISKYSKKLCKKNIKKNKNIPKNYIISRILGIDMHINDEIYLIKKFRDLKIYFKNAPKVLNIPF